jgi:hypothetical protein
MSWASHRNASKSTSACEFYEYGSAGSAGTSHRAWLAGPCRTSSCTCPIDRRLTRRRLRLERGADSCGFWSFSEHLRRNKMVPEEDSISRSIALKCKVF